MGDIDLEDDFNLNLPKGIKIWLSFNRGFYFCYKSFLLITCLSFMIVLITLLNSFLFDESDTTCPQDKTALILWLLFIMHLVDLLSYTFDMIGFVFRNLTFFAVKCLTDVIALGIGITA